ncbi:protein translocase subunit SecDF [Aurantimonas endophytica]|uniref:Multifunctional fusion protein n=1 Tax=Aurantimonas endophytica TaxID=1522175 RepID=A0A7W6HAR1_9HYPH|nr:protein translocase subunit SecDF [Aurantimonas endophytica]MBB4001731.1 SecD/SecF fusion protein [Aurantimonas endophytica]MCO6402632.1 protein translocase subunit SecDF [Aurantimonas endophytica]
MLYFSPWKKFLVLLTVAVGILYAAPNFFPRQMLDQLPSFVPKQQVTLGLDLQGGSYILLEIDRQSLQGERVQTLSDDARQTLRTARIGYAGLSDSGTTVTVRLRDPAQADAVLEALQPLATPLSAGMLGSGSVAEVAIAQPQPGVITLTLTEAGVNYRLTNAVAQSIEVVRRRVDELGTTEPLIQRQGDDRIMVQVPGLEDPQRLKSLLNQTAKLSFRLVDQTASADEVARGTRPPAGSELLYTNDNPPLPILVQRQIMVSGENLTDAQAGFDSQTNQPVVNIRFDSQGAQRFGAVTQQNVGSPFAIVLDEEVLSAPNIREPILGGQAQISGNFTVQSANDLSVLLRAGALPATLNIIEERTVGPGLGADSIAAGETAGVIGSIFVVLFMLAAYGFLGVLANIALVANVLILFAILTAIGATLTLPGIAGIVLTVGMAVDSNVLIFERIRDERRQGRSVIQSIDTGFQKALGTIVDANITTLIAAVVLFFLGSGPVRGFAVTLAIGIVTTVFTAFTLTRLLASEWVRRRRPKELPRGFIKLVPDVTAIRFMKIRLQVFALSIFLCLASIAMLFTAGLNFGIDFTGGTVIEVQAKSGAADVGDIRERLNAVGIQESQVQEFGSESEALIRVGTAEGGDTAQTAIVQSAQQALAADYDFRRTEVVGPTVSGELAWAAVIGVLASLLAILIYVWIRFEWQFAVGAIIATVNDVILTLGFLAVTQLEFNLSTVAAILTIVGYSLNDTVVIYDRIRENLRRFKKMPIGDLLDLSDNEMLARTVMTTMTTLLALFALFIFGGEVIRSFVASMLFGVGVGALSTIFVAAPVLIFFKLRPADFAAKKEDEEAERAGSAAGKA